MNERNSHHDDILHHVNDHISPKQSLFLGLQHVIKFASLIIYPTIIINSAGLTGQTATDILSISIFSIAITTLLFSFKKTGAGCFVSVTSSTALFALIMIAAKMGGLSMVMATTFYVGVLQIIFTLLLRFMKFLFNKELAGFVTLLLGIWVALLGVHEIFYQSDFGRLLLHRKILSTHLANIQDITISLIALAIMIAFRIKKVSTKRLYCISYGIIIAWIIAYFFGRINNQHMVIHYTYSWFQFPIPLNYFSFHIDPSLILPMIIAALISTIEIFGITAMIQQTDLQNNTDFNWSALYKGNIIVGLCFILASVIGAVPNSPNPGSYGILVASGSFSRKIAYGAALILILVSLCPKLILLLLTIPSSINGAAILFVGSAMFTNGLKMIDINNIGRLKAMNFGFSFILGVSSISIPQFYSQNFVWVRGITDPAFFVSLFCFIVLTILHRLFTWRHHE